MQARLLSLLVALAAFAPVSPAHSQHPATRTRAARLTAPKPDAALPLARLLNPDGTLRPSTGLAGSIDARGYRMLAGSGGAPRFTTLQAAPDGDDLWAPGFEGTMDGDVSAVVAAGGALYVGGAFTTAPDGTPVSFVAKWDGATWSSLGGGMDAPVYTLAVDGSGHVYAGGLFSTAGGTPANFVARWDGTAWNALGDGTDGPITTLALDGTDVYAAGGFTTAGGVPANNVARWNGTTWAPLGEGTDGAVYTLAADGAGHVYAGGFFMTAGADSANYIARWDGSAWSALGDGADGPVLTLAVDGTDVYAGGFFTTAGLTPANFVARWDGAGWNALGDGMDAPVSSLTVDGASLYAGGFFTTAGLTPANFVARWDGAGWNALGDGTDAPVAALAVDANHALQVGGLFTRAGTTTASRLAAWDGADWSSYGRGLDAAVLAFAVDERGVLYVGGAFTSAPDGTPANYVAQWDGAAWSALGDGLDDEVYTLAADGHGHLYVGGAFSEAGGAPAGYVAMWDGAAWHDLDTGVGDEVYALAIDAAGDVYAGGSFAEAGSANLPVYFVARWDGAAWHDLDTGVNAPVYALATDGTDVYVGGDFDEAGSGLTPVNYVAKWDGAAWSDVDGGMDAPVYTLAVDGAHRLYAGGVFATAGAASADYVAMWDGTAWAPMGSGMDDAVNALVADGAGNVYAGGCFSTAGGVSAARVAKWNGSTWSALGSGFDCSVYALGFNGNLYVGGDFPSTPGSHSTFLARWDGGSATATQATVGGWRLLSVPHTGLTVAALARINLVQGITAPGGAGDPDSEFAGFAPNLFTGYTGANAAANAGFTVPTSKAEALTAGKGLLWYFFASGGPAPGDTRGTSRRADLPLTLAATGPVVVGDAAVTFTDADRPGATDGFYLLGNPFGQPFDLSGLSIDATSAAAPAALAGVFQVWDAEAGTYRTITVLPCGCSDDETDDVAAWQGFFAEVTDNGVGSGDPGAGAPYNPPSGTPLVFNFARPSVTRTAPVFVGKRGAADVARVRFRLTGTVNGRPARDEAATLLLLDEASMAWDRYDATKRTPLASTPSLALGGVRMGRPWWHAQRSLPLSPGPPVEIPLRVSSPVAGALTLSWGGAPTLPHGWQATLFDRTRQRTVDLARDTAYVLTDMPAGTDSTRLVLRLTSTATGVDEVLAANGFMASPVWPNPAGAVPARLRLRLGSAQHVRVALYDALGRLVATAFDDDAPAQTAFTVPLGTMGLAAGVYVVRIAGERFSTTRTVTVVH